MRIDKYMCLWTSEENIVCVFFYLARIVDGSFQCYMCSLRLSYHMLHCSIFIFFVHNSVHEKSSFNRAQLLNSRSAETFDIHTFIQQEKLAANFLLRTIFVWIIVFSFLLS